jgi:hypothetical protein
MADLLIVDGRGLMVILLTFSPASIPTLKGWLYETDTKTMLNSRKQSFFIRSYYSALQI